MLGIDIDVVKGILFVHLEGVLNKDTVKQFNNEIDYLLYKQGMHYYVFDFKDLDMIESNVYQYLDNKFIEIFLSCGKVVLSGLDKYYENIFFKQKGLYFVDEGVKAFDYLTI